MNRMNFKGRGAILPSRSNAQHTRKFSPKRTPKRECGLEAQDERAGHLWIFWAPLLQLCHQRRSGDMIEFFISAVPNSTLVYGGVNSILGAKPWHYPHNFLLAKNPEYESDSTKIQSPPMRIKGVTLLLHLGNKWQGPVQIS